MSFMNVYKNEPEYENYIWVKQMLDNSQIQLLKVKVKTNQYLSFNDICGSSISTWLKLFSTIQDSSDENEEFYQNLFKNYKNQIPLIDCIEDHFERITNFIIERNCGIALQVLIKHFKFIPSHLNLQCAFKNCNLLVIDTILATNKLIVPLEIDVKQVPLFYPRFNFIKELMNDHTPLMKSPKVFNHYSFTFSNDKIFENSIKSWELFIQLFKPSKQLIGDTWDFQLFKNVNPLYFKLKHLLSIIGLLDTLGQWDKYDKSEFQYPQLWLTLEQYHLFKNSYNYLTVGKSTSLKKEISKFQFSEKHLNSNLNDSFNYSSKQVRESIKKLLHIFYSVAEGLEIGYFSEYYICYGDNDIVGQINSKEYYKNITCGYDSINSNFLYPLQHAHYPSFKNFSEFGSMCSLTQTYNQYNHGVDLFSKCKELKELQIQFLNQLIRDIKLNDAKSIPCWLLFLMLIKHDNLALVKHFVSELGGKQSIVFTENHFTNRITHFVGSTEMMDYLFNEFYHFIDTDPLSPSINIQTSNVEILKHFEKLYFSRVQKSSKLAKLLKLDTTYCNGSLSVEFVLHVLNDLSIYQDYKMVLELKPANFDTLNYQTQEMYFSKLKSVLSQISFKSLKFNPLVFLGDLVFNQYPSKSQVKYLYWLCNRYSLSKIQISQSSLRTHQRTSLLLQYYITGESYDESNEHSSNNLLKNTKCKDIISIPDYLEIIKCSIYKGDTITISRIVNILLLKLSGKKCKDRTISHIKSFILNDILKVIVIEEQLSILKYLHLKFPQIFKIKEKEIGFLNSVYTLSEIHDNFIIPLLAIHCNFKIFEFLFNLFPISKSQFESANPTLLDYFKNKF